ncbi:MAG: hypothetical protein IJU64_06880 [Bacilli bacterium]|nr:hypothetical protein [Bacilli bacterium]
MRRFISYIALSSALILGSALATVPMIMNMDGDLGYADGQTLYFRAATYDQDSDNGNYGNAESGMYSFIDNERYITEGEKAPIEYIAATVRERLDAWGVSGYKVATQGSSDIQVSLRTAKDDETTLNYLRKILSFNGGDFSLDATDTSYEDYSYNEKWADIIDGQTARIEDIDMQGYKVPVVVVPLKEGDDYKTALTDLIKYCNDHTTIAEEAKEGEEQKESVYTNLVVWANRSSLDPESFKDAEKNQNVALKVVLSETCQNDNAVWYDATDKDKANPSLQLIPSSKATQSGTYDPTYTQEAYDAARYILTLMNSGTFEYEAFAGRDVSNKFALTYLYSERAQATVENLIAKAWNKEPAMSKTLISILVIIAFLVLILALFERTMAFIEVAALGTVTFASFATFVAFGAQFNIAALIGLGAVALIALFGALFYSSRLKDEIYKGRTLKKAHSEAAKRSTWPIIDAGILSAILGVFLYTLGGDIASKAGVMLVLGGVYSTIFNLAVTRLAGWMFANDSTTPTKLDRYLHINKAKVPDLLKEEKQSYFGPYADRDFSKGKKAGLIVSCLFLLAGIGSMIGWGVANNGNFFNSGAFEATPTVLQIDVKSDRNDAISIDRLNNVARIYDKNDQAHNAILSNYKVDDVVLSDAVADATLSKNCHQVVVGDDVDNLTNEYWFYYRVTFKKDITTGTNHVYYGWNGSDWEDLQLTSFLDLANQIKADTVSEDSNEVLLSFDTLKPEALTPYFYQVALGVGVGLAVAMVYTMIRYRPSRGLALGLLTASATFSAASFYALTRISTTPVVSLGAITVAVTMLLASLFILAGEKEIYKENRDKDKDNLAFHSECLKVATSRQAGNVVLFILLAVYIAIASFAFGPTAYTSPYIIAILGLALSLLAILTLLQPVSVTFAKGFSLITYRPSLPKKKKKASKGPQGGNLMKKKKGAEPEEAIFIGIND